MEARHSADAKMHGMNIESWSAMGTRKLQHLTVSCVCAWRSHMCLECATPL